jgi:membrane peptidoglycan carboxypeptidase
VYAQGFEQGWSPGSTIYDVQTDFTEPIPGQKNSKPYIPNNYDGKFHGPVSIREALANSYNVPAVKMMALVGKDTTLQTAQHLGISTLTDTKNYGLSLVIGGGDVELLELTGAYGAFANSGAFVHPNAILSVTQGQKVLYTYNPAPTPVFHPEVAYEINSILSDNKAREPIFGPHSALTIPGYTVAAKTGTTQDYRDAWTVGYTPSLVVGVWVGNNDFSPMKTGSAGAMAAAPIWNAYMKQSLLQHNDEPFTAPTDLALATFDSYTGKMATPSSRQTRQDMVAAWQQPTDAQLASYQVIGCDGAVRTTRQTTVVHSEKPTSPQWEIPVQRWAQAHGFSTGGGGTLHDTCAPPPVQIVDAPVAPDATEPSTTIGAVGPVDVPPGQAKKDNGNNEPVIGGIHF